MSRCYCCFLVLSTDRAKKAHGAHTLHAHRHTRTCTATRLCADRPTQARTHALGTAVHASNAMPGLACTALPGLWTPLFQGEPCSQHQHPCSTPCVCASVQTAHPQPRVTNLPTGVQGCMLSFLPASSRLRARGPPRPPWPSWLPTYTSSVPTASSSAASWKHSPVCLFLLDFSFRALTSPHLVSVWDRQDTDQLLNMRTMVTRH